MEKLKITKSSGNVFADIGFPADEAANLLFRATLMARLTKIVNDRELTQQAAAKLFGVTQPRVNLLLRGRIGEFSVDALVNMLGRAGFTVEPRIVKSKATPVASALRAKLENRATS
jgi:predicted XRE-type DNA-binding protein